MLNKPRGIVTKAADEKGTRYGIHLSTAGIELGVGPVGRLDKASEGLLLLTNDSEWAARVSAPETHLDKTYHVQVAGSADEASLEALMKGIRSESGELLRAKTAHVLRKGQRNTWLEIALDEGKNRQIRRMLETREIQNTAARARVNRPAGAGKATEGFLPQYHAGGETGFGRGNQKQKSAIAQRGTKRQALLLALWQNWFLTGRGSIGRSDLFDCQSIALPAEILPGLAIRDQ